MTTKEIALAVGKDERTVQRWIKRVADKMSSVADKMSSVSYRTNGADWALEEVLCLVEVGMGKNAASLFRENASKASAVPPTLTTESIAVIVRETISAMLPMLVAAVKGTIPESNASALPAPPDLSPRDQLRRAVNAMGQKNGKYAEAWTELYGQFFYRYGINLRVKAKNRNLSVLDYAEQEGHIEELLGLALTLGA